MKQRQLASVKWSPIRAISGNYGAEIRRCRRKFARVSHKIGPNEKVLKTKGNGAVCP